MTSWRDSASEMAQRDLDELLNAGLGFAQQQLSKHGEFYPYAVAIRTDGHTEMIAARPDIADEHPPSAKVIASCLSALLDKRDQIRAAAVVADVRLPDRDSDAIEVSLEHAEGATLKVLLPYAKRRLRKDIDYGQMLAQQSARARRIWNDS